LDGEALAVLIRVIAWLSPVFLIGTESLRVGADGGRASGAALTEKYLMVIWQYVT
jgi:hypothetical protein